MLESESPSSLHRELRTAWHRFVDLLVPHRPALFGYCRRLTGNVFDAEDLAQDTLVRAFGQWGVTSPPIRNPRAYLLRTATNVWIDTLRHRGVEAQALAAEPNEAPPSTSGAETALHLRDAGARLLGRLSPQERAAVVLKEAFDMSLEEIAATLSTSVGAVKAALHRGRGRLEAAAPAAWARRRAATPELLDRFIERFEAKDVKGLVALMLEDGASENVGNSFHLGLDPVEGVPSFLDKVVNGHPEWPAIFTPDSSRLVRAWFEGEPILLRLSTRRGREALEVVLRLEEEAGRIARIRAYGFCPDTVRAVGEALGLPVVTGLYRAPTPAPGARWPEPAKAQPVAG